jgi:hypothetical protein
LLEPATAASNGGLIVLLAYGVIGGLGPILLLRDPKLAAQMRHWLLAFPMGLAVLGLGIAIAHPSVPALFWPVDLLLQFLGLALALVAGGIVVALVVMLGLLGSIALWILSPAALLGLDGPLFCAGLLLGGLTLIAGLLWLGQNLGSVRKRMGLSFEDASPAAALSKDELLPWLTASPVLGAFALLGLAFNRQGGQAPHTGMATALCLLIVGLALAQRLKHAALAAVTALSATLALASWAALPAAGLAPDALGWSLGFWALLCAAPFVLYTLDEDWLPAWCAHALAMAGLSVMVMALGRQLFTPLQGAPLLLALTLLQLIAVARLVGQLQGKPARNSLLAFWGAGLLLLVSAFPVLLLERGWLGLAFVFEGAGLVWLNGRVRHPLLPALGLIAGIYGVVDLVLRYAELRGADAAPLGNPAFLAIAAATVLQTLAALEARRQSPDYPQGWRVAQRWTAVGMGFYLMNLAIAESFGKGPANGFDLSAHDDWMQYCLYTLCWAVVGGGLWAFLRQRSVMAWAAFGLLMIAVLRTVTLPWVYPLWVPGLGPWVNPAWLVFLPVIAILSALRLWELRRGGGDAARAMLWALLAVIFIAFKVESSSTLQGGEPLRLLLHHNAPHALSQAAAWSLFGLILLLWPRELEEEFRLAGLGLFILACLRGASIPLRYADAWPDSLPLLNGVWLCLAAQSVLLFWLARREWPKGRWPGGVAAASLLGPLAVAAGFFTVNVGVAQCFRESGQALHLDAQGSLGQRLANSLSWMAYGLGLLFGGIRGRSRGLRLVGLALMAVTAVRVFLGDLYKMGGLYRVAAFVGLAFSLLLVSYLYQRFGSQAADQKEER